MVSRGPSAKPGIGGRPKKRGCQARFHNTTPLRPPTQLAEGVEFPERYADSSSFGPSFGGERSNLRKKCRAFGCFAHHLAERGSPGWTTTRLVVILNRATLPRPPALGNSARGNDE